MSTTDAPSATPLLEVSDLVVHFHKGSGFFSGKGKTTIHAVCGVNFTVNEGETLGLVGESGCGKTTTGRAILQLEKATSGSVKLNGLELTTLDRDEMKKIRRNLQVVFQDPFGSLDPKMTVGRSIAEPLEIHKEWDKATGNDRVGEVLNLVGLNPKFATRFPNELSGGQRQRIGIARALIMEPKMLILDEPVSALDVSVQAGVVNLLADLQDRLGISYLFVAHDLSVVRHVSDRVAVMYLGKIVEIGDKVEIYSAPQHPYTQALLSAAPLADPIKERRRKHIILTGDVPSAAAPPTGCRFRTRCWKAQDICASEEPVLKTQSGGHQVACHFPEAVEVL
ncbi:MAG: oligopeptide/dipeptide ABC transporter ATP-binding protein [Actinomycetota bacterium]